MSRKTAEIVGFSVLMAILAVVSTHPLINYFDRGIPFGMIEGETFPNRSGDQFQLLYWFWLVKENFIGNVPFNTNPYEFNMLTPNGLSGINTIPLAFLYMLFTPFGDVTAYNCLIFSSYILAGLFMYLLTYQYCGSRTGALLAAIIFTFAPSRVKGMVGGHGYGFLYFLYPFIIYFLEKGLRSRKVRYGILSGIGYVSLAMLEPHLIYYLSIFLGIYLPIRIIAHLPVCQGIASPIRIGKYNVFLWSELFSFIVLLVVGVTLTMYSQILIIVDDNSRLVMRNFWWTISTYPLLSVFLSLCLAAVYQRVTALSFQESMAVEAFSFLPLLILFTLCGAVAFISPVNTEYLVYCSLVLLAVSKAILLRKHLAGMVKVLFKGIKQEKKSLYAIVPLILAIAGVVYWMAGAKVEAIGSTIAGGGRTLRDVELFSAHLADLFYNNSVIYIGILPAAILMLLIIRNLYEAVRERRRERFDSRNELIILFYITIAYCCLLLSLGLAFGKSSLYVLFYNFFPFFNYPRVSDRIFIVVLFALAVLSGFLVKKIQGVYRGRLASIVISLLVIVAAVFQLKDFNVFKPMSIIRVDKGQSIYEYVKKNIGEKVLLEIPLWPGDSHQSSLYQHYIMLDRIPRVNGYSPLVQKDYIDTVYEPLAPINQGKLGRGQYDVLRKLNVGFLTFHDNPDVFLPKISPYPRLTTIRRLKNSPYLEYVDIDNEIYFEHYKKKYNNLYLFRVREPSEISEPVEKAWYEMPYFYSIHTRLHQQTGEIALDKSIRRKAFHAAEGKHGPGFLVYGPYDTYPPGKYRCYYTVKIEGDRGENVARLEVSAFTKNQEQKVLADKDLRANGTGQGYINEYVDFSIDQPTRLEFRVFYSAKGNVWVEKIAMNGVKNYAPVAFIKAEKMAGETGVLVSDKESSTGKVIEAIAGKSKKGDMVYGPNKVYPRGKYQANFILRAEDVDKSDHPKNTVVAKIFVRDGQSNEILAEHPVVLSEVDGPNFSEVGLDFELQQEEFLSFQVYFPNTVSLQLDGIHITAR